MLTDIHAIQDRIALALHRGESLRLEYDSGPITLEGRELAAAWDDMTLDDPFTIHD